MIDGYWLPVRDGDPRARAVYLRHYSANKNASRYLSGKFTGPGEYMLLLGKDCAAVWLWRLERFRRDGQAGLNCAVFRNESSVLSSLLIREACGLAWQRWPGVRLFTYVADAKIRSINPGACFKHAGWRSCGRNATGKLTILECLPEPIEAAA